MTKLQKEQIEQTMTWMRQDLMEGVEDLIYTYVSDCMGQILGMLEEEKEDEKIKPVLTRFEFDLLDTGLFMKESEFRIWTLLNRLKEKGHFKGVKDEMTIGYILDNCGVEE